MKKSHFLTKLFALFMVAALFTSCTRDLLVSKQAIRNLDLVKVESMDRDQLPAETVLPLTHIDQIQTLEPRDEVALAETVFQDLPINTTGLSFNARSVITKKEIRKAAMQQVGEVKTQRIEKDKKKGDEQKPALDLLRLLLYILIALLVISLLGILLPGYLVGIVVLVLLIAGLLYLLGGV